MRPISFENLRRLMGGGRKKKEKESSFKRSESFKRISIRKNYLERGGKKRQQQQQKLQQIEVLQDIAGINPVVPEDKVSAVKDRKVVKESSLKNDTAKKEVDSNKGKEETPSFVAYGQWLKGVRVSDGQSSSHSGIKGSERTVIYIPASDDLPSPPVLRQMSASPVQRRKSPLVRRKKPENKTSSIKRQNDEVVCTVHSLSNENDSVKINARKIVGEVNETFSDIVNSKKPLSRNVSTDSAVEMFPWGDSVELLKFEKSPIFPRRQPQLLSRPSPPSLLLEPAGGSEEMCSLSVSLGRIWMDAPMAMTPKSLELTRPSTHVDTAVHYSLDSALKERRDEPVVNKLQKHTKKKGRGSSPIRDSALSVSRTLSSTQSGISKTPSSASTDLFSSKDSGFSFSVSAPKLTDIPTKPTKASGGFFKRKQPKPKLSVSRDGYFKRTSGALETRRTSVKRNSSRKKKNRNSGRKKKSSSTRSDLYQVVVNRQSKSVNKLKLDPMIFVPPEKRKNSVKRKQSFKNIIKEIREIPLSKDDSFNPYLTIDSNAFKKLEDIEKENSSVNQYNSINSEITDDELYACITEDFDVPIEEINGRMSRIDNISLKQEYDMYSFPPSVDLNKAPSRADVCSSLTMTSSSRDNSLSKSSNGIVSSSSFERTAIKNVTHLETAVNKTSNSVYLFSSEKQIVCEDVSSSSNCVSVKHTNEYTVDGNSSSAVFLSTAELNIVPDYTRNIKINPCYATESNRGNKTKYSDAFSINKLLKSNKEYDSSISINKFLKSNKDDNQVASEIHYLTSSDFYPEHNKSISNKYEVSKIISKHSQRTGLSGNFHYLKSSSEKRKNNKLSIASQNNEMNKSNNEPPKVTITNIITSDKTNTNISKTSVVSLNSPEQNINKINIDYCNKEKESSENLNNFINKQIIINKETLILNNVRYLKTSDFIQPGKNSANKRKTSSSKKPYPSSEDSTILDMINYLSDCDSDSVVTSSDNCGDNDGDVDTWSSEYEDDSDSRCGLDGDGELLECSDIERVPLGVSPVPRRKPVLRRRKSALSQARTVSYVARPSIHRAPSTLRHGKKKVRRKCDITQKGYEKKRTRLLSPYVPKQASGGGGGGGVGPPGCGGGSGEGGGQQQHTRARRTQRRVTHNEKRYHSGATGLTRHPHVQHRRHGGSAGNNRRLTRNESRYHSEVRQEAVQQALAAMQNRPKPSLPMPSKRTSVMAKSPDRELRDSASSSDEDSIVMEGGVGQQLPPPPPLSDTSSAGSPPPHHKHRSKHEITDITDVMHNLRPYTQPPDVTHNTAQGRRPTAADRVNRYASSSDDTMGTGTGRWKVSAKIQQLLNTLKRPKRRPLPEFYEDDDIELEIAANPKDPNAPKPEGGAMTSAVGEQLAVPSGLPRNLEAAIQRYGSATFKAPVATVLDPNGKLTVTLTYGKLLSRSHKIAYTLLNKSFSKGGETSLKSGDRVALVYPNNDPINFLCALYGCFQAGIVPVPIEVPLTRRDAGSQQIGFLLGSCGVQVALTSEACLKGLPKTTAGDVVAFKGWPKLHWLVTEHVKAPKDWLPPPRITDDTPAYIEYTTDREGSVMGVTVTRSAMLNHCRMLTMACGYTEGENMVCVLDFKREVGLWHGVLTSVLNGMHVIYIPYALMKINPASWMQMITKYRASVAIAKSRDLHWGLLATKDHKEVSLSSLRMLLVADGANPWSLSSCDQFLSVFQAKGLRADAVCPCACSSEVLTVSLRRPGRAGAATGRGVLSMAGLSHGVVRVDQENSLTSLTLQDCGQVMPGSEIVVVKIDGLTHLCKTDEVGEICVSSGATGNQYWGLPGLSNAVFRVLPMTPPVDGQATTEEQRTPVPATAGEFVRSGLLGFLGPGGLVFVCGSRDGLMTVTGRKHNADDIIATVLAVEPMKFIYRGRIAVFSIRVLRDERICVIAEQRPDCSEEESFQWMSRVLQAVDSIHQVGIYCLALVPANHLPKTPLGGIHLSECRRRFLDGSLHPANVLMCPHTCVTNLPKPREVHSAASVADVGPASVIVGNLVQGNRLASAQGRELGPPEEDSDAARKYHFLSEILRWRAHTTPDHVLFTLLNAKGGIAKAMSCSELHKRAEKVASLLSERGRVNTGAHVALVFPPGLDLVCAFYGCLYVGAVPVTIRPPHPQNLQTTLPTVRMIVDVSKAALVLSSQPVIKLLRSKEAGGVIDTKSWPPILDTDDATKRKPALPYRAPTAEMLAYLDFSVSTTGMLAGIKMSHSAVTSLCRSMKLACELYPSRHVALCLDPYCGLGFALWVLSSVYSGHHSILIPPSEVEVNPALWLSAVSQHRVRDTFCSYGVMELCTKGLGSSVGQLKARGLSLACVRTCVVVAEERPRIALTTSFSKLFSSLGLSPRAVSTSFGCRVNVAICLQGAASPEPASVYVDLRALRNDRVTLVERGSPHSLCLLESGKLLPGVKVIIANPETHGQCGDSHLGEIWVQSPHNASGYFTIYGDETEYSDHFNAKLVTGGTGESYARTGYLGFLRRTEGGPQVATDIDTLNEESNLADTASIHTAISQQMPASESGELHDAVFVVGALDETIMLRGMRYHPIDIENSVLRCHKKIAECAVFTWTNLLVVVVELDGNESEALDVVPLVTNTVLEEQQLIVGVVVVVDPGVVPVNSRGEKQRMHLRDGFLADQLDPIYVAYNM